MEKVLGMRISFKNRVKYYESLYGNSDIAVFIACVEDKVPRHVLNDVLEKAKGAAIKRRYRNRNFKEHLSIDLLVATFMLSILTKYGSLEYKECKKLFERLLHPF